MNVLSSPEVVKSILDTRDRFVLWLGAGASVEAGVKTADEVCWEIREALVAMDPVLREADAEAVEAWAREKLDWDDPHRRYRTCIHSYKTAPARVDYFRQMLRGVQPSFAHHAAALLMTHNYLRPTCLTTNFDHLLENAFVHQGFSDSQVLRSEHDLDFWEPQSPRTFVVKLHGDIDTRNILNTTEETFSMAPGIKGLVKRVTENSGLVVLGAGGYEASVRDMIRHIGSGPQAVPYGLLWGVYVGEWAPEITAEEARERVVAAVPSQVSSDIRDVIETSSNDLYGYFPVFGAGQFFFDLLERVEDRSLFSAAEHYLDHEMRLRFLFNRSAKLSHETTRQHLHALRTKRQQFDSMSATSSGGPDHVMSAQDEAKRVEVRIVYGDITSRSLMGAREFEAKRRAVVSPEDTYISAGGGVAYGLLRRSGTRTTLTELAKFAPIEQRGVVATSAGELPVHYVLHAAALEIVDHPENPYEVTVDDVRGTARNVLELADALEVEVLWVPLLGAGVAGLDAADSLAGIVSAAVDFGGARSGRHMVINVVVFANRLLDRHDIRQTVEACVGSEFSITG